MPDVKLVVYHIVFHNSVNAYFLFSHLVKYLTAEEVEDFVIVIVSVEAFDSFHLLSLHHIILKEN